MVQPILYIVKIKSNRFIDCFCCKIRNDNFVWKCCFVSSRLENKREANYSLVYICNISNMI